MINLGIARLNSTYNFKTAIKYFKESYFKNPISSREKKHNNIYFERDLKKFIKLWKSKGKKDRDFNSLLQIMNDLKNKN